MRNPFSWLLAIVLFAIPAAAAVVYFGPEPDSAKVTVVHESETRKGSMYETPTEKLVTLSDGRKFVCLQASHGALWCTPALSDSK